MDGIKITLITPIFFLLVILPSGIIGTSNAESTINIVALGDSLTYGTGDPRLKGYIIRTQKNLERKLKTNVVLHNYGIPKFRTTHVLQTLRKRQVQNTIQEADFILVFIGTNDFRFAADYNFNQINIKKMTKAKEKYVANLESIIGLVRWKNERSPILLIGLYNPYLEMKEKQKLASIIQDWNNEIKMLTGSKQLYYVPTYDLFTNIRKDDYFADHIHPNIAGYKRISERVTNQILTIMSNS